MQNAAWDRRTAFWFVDYGAVVRLTHFCKRTPLSRGLHGTGFAGFRAKFRSQVTIYFTK